MTGIAERVYSGFHPYLPFHNVEHCSMVWQYIIVLSVTPLFFFQFIQYALEILNKWITLIHGLDTVTIICLVWASLPGDRAFFAAARTLWNAPPDELRALGSLKTFMARLKTHYFKLQSQTKVVGTLNANPFFSLPFSLPMLFIAIQSANRVHQH